MEWDRLDSTTWHRPMTAMTVETFLSGETGSAFINLDGGKFWLSIPDQAGQSPFETLAAAQAAGDRALAELDAKQASEIARSEGLDDEWAFQLDRDLPTFVSAAGFELTRMKRGEWAVFEGDEELLKAPTAADAASQLAARNSFAPSI
ncbi:hypothetical protein OCUBac02_49280 (plasmid) [Bosea sp. ANAM02]|nr:hypothetical protein OCUBac02_49280 [Bosea sp. ANAM02]